MKRKNKKEIAKRYTWMVAGALALTAVGIFLVTFYSGSLTLAAFHGLPSTTATNVATVLNCSFSNNLVQAQLSVPGTTMPAGKLDNLRIAWSLSDASLGKILPPVSHTVRGGLAQAGYNSHSTTTNVATATFTGGRASEGIMWPFTRGTQARYSFEPSSCHVNVTGVAVTGVSPTPTPSITPIKDPTPPPTITPSPTPKPTVCPRVCRFVNGKLQCGCGS